MLLPYNCQLSTVNCQLSSGQLSTIHDRPQELQCGFLSLCNARDSGNIHSDLGAIGEPINSRV
ncbi:hypothetical protein [Microcoleus sp. herbarium12]|uniref:hypothetical protein n=1 Tax=Microcoleus sp. herbarium12 TaxID=3055437 RepID=UPI002FD46C8C